jgi:hypothetical protein
MHGNSRNRGCADKLPHRIGKTPDEGSSRDCFSGRQALAGLRGGLLAGDGRGWERAMCS